MAQLLTDEEIKALLSEPKMLPSNWSTRLRARPKANLSCSERSYELRGDAGHRFNLIVRRSSHSPLDFSVILIYVDDQGNEYRLRRHNGAHPSRHTSAWEKRNGLPNKQLEMGCHIHMATERYQRADLNIDGYAELTDTYSDFDTALLTMFKDALFVLPDSPPDPQMRLLL